MAKLALLLVFLGPRCAAAQETSQRARPEAAPTQVGASLRKGTFDLGVFASGGSGHDLGSDTQFASAGARLGLVLTEEHGSGWRRGNFEWAVEVLPLYSVFTLRRVVYGGNVMPAMWRWNFTSGRTIAPYVLIAGGILFSTRNLPPGNTSWVNFTPQAAVGANFFVKSRGAFTFEGAYVHHSNAGLGTDNPGYNAALFFTIGYSWFRRAE
jgi:lipid A 3-O-deacylase